MGAEAMSVPVNVERHVVINDVHVPYHDVEIMEAFLEFCKDEQPEVIHINGDFIDFPQISKYDKDPKRLLELQDDIDVAVILLEDIRRVNPEAEIIYHDGNHEHRLYKYKKENPELMNLRSFSIPGLLQFEKLDIKHLHYDKPYIWKDTFVIWHGDVVRKHAGYSAKGEMENWGMSGISGHTHRLSSHFKTDKGGEYAWYENGCMCMKDKVDYMSRKPNWQHGFSIIFFKNDSHRFYVQQIPIADKAFIYKGKHYGK